jgi:hypothetical protein
MEEIGVISKDFDREFSSAKEVSPIGQAEYDS